LVRGIASARPQRGIALLDRWEAEPLKENL
jgi:hypothetical protein